MFQSSFHLILNSFPSLLLRLIWNGSVSFEVCFEFCNSGSILDLWNLTELLNHPAYFPTPRQCLYKLSFLLLTKHDVYNIQCKFHWNRDKYLRGLIKDFSRVNNREPFKITKPKNLAIGNRINWISYLCRMNFSPLNKPLHSIIWQILQLYGNNI